MTAFDCSIVPENFTGALRKAAPDTLIIADACSMGISPGEFRKVPLEKITDEDSFNSHSPGIIELIRYLNEFIPEIIFIGIEPASMEFGEGVSPEVQEGISRLEEIIIRGDIDKICEAG